jgi:hypothetical protein
MNQHNTYSSQKPHTLNQSTFPVTHLPSSPQLPILSLNSSILPINHPLTAPFILSSPTLSIRFSALPSFGLFFSAHPNLTLLPALQDPGRHAHCTQSGLS